MPKKVIFANLNLHPEQIVSSPGYRQFTIGDLHGNVMKLIYFLISQGLLILKNNSDYQLLYEIYITGHNYDQKITVSQITPQQVQSFKLIIEQASINQQQILTIVRLIGDELADRGGNDFLTLLVIDKLQTSSSIQLIVLFSNHGAWALSVYQLLIDSTSYTDFKIKFANQRGIEFTIDQSGLGENILTNGDLNGQMSSMHGLFYLLEQDPVTLFLEAKQLLLRYQKSLAIIDYSISKNNELAIYTHAPIDLTDIKNLADYYQLNFPKLQDIKAIVQIIEDINKQFQKTLHQNPNLIITELSNNNSPIFNFIWSRRATHGQYIVPEDMLFIHGHDGLGKSPAGMINLDDSNLGKPREIIGELPVYIL